MPKVLTQTPAGKILSKCHEIEYVIKYDNSWGCLDGSVG